MCALQKDEMKYFFVYFLVKEDSRFSGCAIKSIARVYLKGNAEPIRFFLYIVSSNSELFGVNVDSASTRFTTNMAITVCVFCVSNPLSKASKFVEIFRRNLFKKRVYIYILFINVTSVSSTKQYIRQYNQYLPALYGLTSHSTEASYMHYLDIVIRGTRLVKRKQTNVGWHIISSNHVSKQPQ